MGLLPTRDAAARVPGARRRHPRADLGRRRRGRRTLVNRAWREFTGAGPEDDLGDGWLARVHPDDAAALHRDPHGRDRRGRAVRAGVPPAPRGRPLPLGARPRRPVRRGHLRRRLPGHRRPPPRAGAQAAAGRPSASAMDAETTVAARREVFLRALVDEGLVDLARLVDMAGHPRTVAVAAARPEDAQVMWGLDPPCGPRPEPDHGGHRAADHGGRRLPRGHLRRRAAARGAARARRAHGRRGAAAGARPGGGPAGHRRG